MASGTAIIASAAGGVIDIIDDGMTGLLFTPSNINELAEKLLVLCKSQEKRSAYAQNARHKTDLKYQKSVNDTLLLELL